MNKWVICSHGTHLEVLGAAMEEFTKAVFDLPDGTVCKPSWGNCL